MANNHSSFFRKYGQKLTELMPFRHEMCDELNGKIGKNENEKNDETFYSEKLANLIRSGYFLDFADETEKMKKNISYTRAD